MIWGPRAPPFWLEPLAGVGPRACDTLNGQRLGAKRRAGYLRLAFSKYLFPPDSAAARPSELRRARPDW
eukprot:scaffold55680_cov71-Phaeocystis_antarctica.AAC.1